MPSQVDTLVKELLEKLPVVKDVDSAVTLLKERMESLLPGYTKDHEEAIEEARAIVLRQLDHIEVLHRYSIMKKRRKWYFGPKPSDLHWPRLRGYFLNEKGWSEEEIATVDASSTEVVSLLEPPSGNDFSCRGLVLGYVQSGKTANMTAVIAKALDAGYTTIVVLAGITNKLRFQTQRRLMDDLFNRNPLLWHVLTPDTEDGDFRAPPYGGFISETNRAHLAVIKKNVSPLRELALAIERTMPAVREKLRVLVIDDECDQASVNSAKNEIDMTAINQKIREILSKIPAVSYVGYTATPFANVLINPYRADGVDLDDLYPRDFITSLPKNDSYFGAERLFGKTPVDPNNPSEEEEGLDMIRTIPEADRLLLQPENAKSRTSFYPRIADSLIDATLYYLACCAARLVRGDKNKHMTMLVHTSAFVILHHRVATALQEWISDYSDSILATKSQLNTRLERIWKDEQGRLPSDITSAPTVSYDELIVKLGDVLEALEVVVENGASDDRIDYTKGPKIYIVVGGSILARGLTIEGLMVSYFLRSANQYDTLLQMGRWFGYRKGYEDLPRIWMTDDLSARFRELASVEQEVRDEIDQYRLLDQTPMDVAVRIRSLPGMAITAAAKMRHARECAVSFWSTHRQTTRFNTLDDTALKANWKAASSLIERCVAQKVGQALEEGNKVWRHIHKSCILRFLREYSPHSSQSDMGKMMLSFLESADSRLDYWSVGIVESRNGSLSEASLGPAGQVKLVTRAKLRGGQQYADIKALMSRTDIWIDCKGTPPQLSWDDLKAMREKVIGAIPLLLIYPIDRNSKPARASKERVALDASYDVIGIAVVFPGAKAEGGSFVSVELRPVYADDLDAIDEEEREQAEAAGVP